MRDVRRTTTERGFGTVRWRDMYGARCSVQESSLAEQNAIWLGVDDAEPKVMARKAAGVGVQTSETVGWVDYPIPDCVLLTTRMHLNQEMARWLIEELQYFVETGYVRCGRPEC